MADIMVEATICEIVMKDASKKEGLEMKTKKKMLQVVSTKNDDTWP